MRPVRHWLRPAAGAGRRRAAATVVGIGVGVAFLLAGCGIPTESAARSISESQVPYHLLSPTAPTVTTPTLNSYVTVNVYFTVTNKSVVKEPRFIPPPASLTAVIDALLKGPKFSELQTGVQTSLNNEVKLLSTHVAGGIAKVNFNPAFGDLSGFQQVLAVAQVVWTVATWPGGTLHGTGIGVEFEIGGFQIQVPLSTGQLITGPVHLKQYASLLAPTPTPKPVPAG
jgi:Sporulation and spore germination